MFQKKKSKKKKIKILPQKFYFLLVLALQIFFFNLTPQFAKADFTPVYGLSSTLFERMGVQGVCKEWFCNTPI
jgi:hypothetical protein